MAVHLRWRGGAPRLDLGKVDGKVDAAGRRALKDGAEYLLEEANRSAPIEEGTLIRSGTVSTSADGRRAAVAYDTPYAVRQHEDTRNRHDPGRRARWLALALRERSAAITDHIGRAMREAL